MKFSKMTLTLLTVLAISAASLTRSQAAQAEGTQVHLSAEVLSQIQPPEMMQNEESAPAEGTETHLTAEVLSELGQWAQLDLKTVLESALSDATTAEEGTLSAINHLRDKMALVLNMSGAKRTSLLSRFALNRGLKLLKVLDEVLPNQSGPGVFRQKLLVLKASVRLALCYYKSEMAFYNNQVQQRTESILNQNYVGFAFDYSKMLISINESLLNAKAQYRIMRLVLGFLLVDLTRDEAKRDLFAQVILELYVNTKEFPENPGSSYSDAQLVQMVRKMRKYYRQTLERASNIDKELAEQIRMAQLSEQERERQARLTIEERERAVRATAEVSERLVHATAEEKELLNRLSACKEGGGVAHDGGNWGKIKTIFSNGTDIKLLVAWEMPGSVGVSTEPFSKCFCEIGWSDGYVPGSAAAYIKDDKNWGTVMSVYQGGRVKVSWEKPGSRGIGVNMMSDMEPVQESLRGIRKGTKIAHSGGNYGVALWVFRSFVLGNWEMPGSRGVSLEPISMISGEFSK